MNNSLCRRISSLFLYLALPVAALAPVAGMAQDAASTKAPTEAETAWKALNKLNQPPAPPEDWQTNQPSKETVSAFYLPTLMKIADAARDFYTKFPDDTNASKAAQLELSRLTIAEQNFGETNNSARIDALIAKTSSNPNATTQEKLASTTRSIQKLIAKLPDSLPQLEKSGRDLIKQYPKETIGYQVLMLVMQNSEGDAAAKLAKELTGENVPEQIREHAKMLTAQLDMLNKPLDLKYTAVDGREVDISKLKGKVVLVDFWATWCGPCMAELPNVKAAYAELHEKGFEILGISFDQDKDKLTSTLASKGMTWAQYFDGEGWGNKFGKQWGIQSIPTMWLVNKKGVLCDVNGRENLKEKLVKLLAESI